jgi:hypothetical protein
VLAILGGIGIVIRKQAETKQETQVIREQTNGTATAMFNHLVTMTSEAQAMNRELMAMIERLGDKLAVSMPPEVLPAIVEATVSTTPEAPSYPAAPGGYPTQTFPTEARDQRAA